MALSNPVTPTPTDPIDFHNRMDEDASRMHFPKGHRLAANGTALTKDASGNITYIKTNPLPAALSFDDASAAPTTEVDGDVYVLGTELSTLTVTDIEWQSGTTVRISFSGSPDLSSVTTDDYFVISTATNDTNNGRFLITAVNDGSDYVEIDNSDRPDATDDETPVSLASTIAYRDWDGAINNEWVTYNSSVDEWQRIEPETGLVVYLKDEDTQYSYDGSVWSQITSGGGIPTYVSTDHAIPRADGIEGTLQDSGILIDDSDEISGLVGLFVDDFYIDDSYTSSKIQRIFSITEEPATDSRRITLNTGNEATATSVTRATGEGAMGLGARGAATGDYAVAIGTNTGTSSNVTLAQGDNSIAIGNKVEATGIQSTCLGRNAKANGDYSMALGNTRATASTSFSFGNSVIASASKAFAIGTSLTSFGADNSNANTVKIYSNSNTESLDITSSSVDAPHLRNYIHTLSATTGTIDLSAAADALVKGTYRKITATGNVTLNQVSTESTTRSSEWQLEFTQDGAGGHTLTLGTNFLTSGGAAPTVSSGVGETDIFTFRTDSAGKSRLINHETNYS